MKNYIFQVGIFLLILAAACEKEPLIRFGFSTEFSENSNGLSIMKVTSDVDVVKLSGGIQMHQGRIIVELLNPDGEIIYTRQFDSCSSYAIHETFDAKKGYWKLQYKSIGGTGKLSIHLFSQAL